MALRVIVVGLGLTCATLGAGAASAADVLSSEATVAPEPALEPQPAFAPQPAFPPQPYITLFQEVRVGVFAHNPNHDEDAPVDVSVETLSSNLPFANFSNPYVNWFLSPRIALGGMINTGGKTSYAFADFNWRIPIWKMLFFEGEFGGAVNNSPDWQGPNRIDMGCPLTFRESGGFGLQLTPNWDVIASVAHASHASFCTSKNPGDTDFGVMVGYKF
jgi:lipid A 3-O-deacylase